MNDIIGLILKITLAILALFGGKEVASKLIFIFSKKKHSSIISSSSVESVGRDKIIIHQNYFNSPGIGDPDKLLKGSAVPIEVSYYEQGFKQLDITEEQLKRIGYLIHVLSNIKLNGLRSSKFPEKGVTNDHHRHLQGAIFAFGTEGVNKEWKEHTASSIREMLSIFSSSDEDFNNTLNKYNDGQNQNIDLDKIKAACIKIKKYYQFFTGVTHHQQAAITNGFRQLEDPATENEKCLTVESFKIVFGHFFTDMKKIIENLPNL